MISAITGKIIFKGIGFLIIETSGGVGYKVYASPDTLNEAQKNSENLKIWTHLHNREDGIDLYGFKNYAELEFFETLIKVSGVGPKSALAFFNLAPIDTLKNAIASEEAAYLTKVSGIGRKTAEKIIIELKDKFGGKSGAVFQFKEDEDVFEALLSLGYAAKDVRDAMNKISKETKGTENKIKEVLKILGK